jgi:hypothetical protein
MRFVKFDLPNSHECVYINGPLVRTVRAVSVKNNAQSVLAFDVEHSITVTGAPEETVRKLEVASVDLFQRPASGAPRKQRHTASSSLRGARTP